MAQNSHKIKVVRTSIVVIANNIWHFGAIIKKSKIAIKSKQCGLKRDWI